MIKTVLLIDTPNVPIGLITQHKRLCIRIDDEEHKKIKRGKTQKR
jgi:hypothetical protein